MFNNRRSLFVALFLFIFTLIVVVSISKLVTKPAPQLLTDPFLQLPTENSVRVVWFTEFAGSRHTVTYGEGLGQTAIATTTKLSRIREDQKSQVGKQTETNQIYQKPVMRDIWRHEAVVTGLTPGKRVSYRVTSITEDGQQLDSNQFTLAAKPNPQTPLKILLTSDHQLMPMTTANLQKVAETIGRVDAVFFAGDLVNIPDRASEWFDDNRGGAFFPSLQGRGNCQLDKAGIKTTYTGGELIQHAPLFTAIGNHEVMGRFSQEKNLKNQFNDPFPRALAQQTYQNHAQTLNPKNDLNLRQSWLKNNSFNIDTYNEIFTLPQNQLGGKKYYAVTFGDIRLVVLYITNIWRTPNLKADARGRYRERETDINNPDTWGYGQHIFEPITPGSLQYQWLQSELNSPEFQQAKYKVVMFHHPPHSLGDNIVPAYTDPVQITERDAEGNIQAVRYEYPKAKDYIIRDVMPLLEKAKVQLVYYGHSHLWNRFVSPSGMHFLESSNVGNTYGAAYKGNKQRTVPEGYQEDYTALGDPNGLEPIIPNLLPVFGEDNQPLPYIASNDITVFSILDTDTGTVSSYRFDTRNLKSVVVKFDEFKLRN
ncbi:MAG: metallophosphoesterase family protein [Symploca sp. SIO2G7]|nr:metallophosphoesterase family protein [Symploca sp. SIO2G7]